MRVHLTAADRERLTRFRAAFNQVEHAIKTLSGSRAGPLARLIERLSETHPEWKFRQSLLEMTRLRNEIAHAEGTDYLRAVPTEGAIAELKRILKSITWLDAVGQRFGKEVECVSSGHTLTQVLDIVRARDYSQFPVVDGPRLRGLLTENGITRWLA